MLPAYQNGWWSYTVERFPDESVKKTCFPDENYDYAAMTAEGSIFLGAYDGDKCV